MDGDDSTECENFEFAELFGLFSGEDEREALKTFQNKFWGKQVAQWTLCSEAFQRLHHSFHQGDLAEILKQCRKEETNAFYSEDEINDMMHDLENNKKTLILPFCFTPGATDLKRSFIAEMGNYGSGDIEVGVYCSQVGGSPAPWHYDNNHNITIQLQGQKDWHCAPRYQQTFGNRALHDPPKNRIEQQEKLIDLNNTTIYHLDVGSVIYLPPGHWHSVVPVQGESISVDIRVANLLHSKWICEAIFTSLLETFTQNSNNMIGSLSAEDRDSPSFTKSMKEQMLFISNNIESIVSSCPIPRPLIPEEQYSDGIECGGSIEYLQQELGDKLTWEKLPERVSVNNLVAMRLKQHGGGYTIIHMISVSPLSDAEYFRYNLYCPNYYYGPMQKLLGSGFITLQEWNDLLKELKPDCEYPHLVLEILLFANVIHSNKISQNRKRQRVS